MTIQLQECPFATQEDVPAGWQFYGSTTKDFNLCHLYWLKYGWEGWDDEVQFHYDMGTTYYKELVKRVRGFGDFDVFTRISNADPFVGKPVVISIDFSENIPRLLINTASFFEGETRRLLDDNEEEYRLNPTDAIASTKRSLRDAVKSYLDNFKVLHDGKYGVVKYIKI